MTLKQLLESLSPQERARLNYAHENQIPQYVVLPDGRYLGVYTKAIPYLTPEVSVGDWSLGVVNDHTNRTG